MSTSSYKNFEIFFSRIDAFYIEVHERQNGLKPSIKELAAELALMQLVAMADSYRNSIMRLILDNRPEILSRSKQKLDYSYLEIMALGNWENLREQMIQKELDNWTNISYGNWIRKLKREEVLPKLSLTPEQIEQLEEIIATRNILAHNNGIIDQEYIRRSQNWYGISKQDQPQLDTKRGIDKLYYTSASMLIKLIIKSIDEKVCILINS